MGMRRVVIGLLGTTLDRARVRNRWDGWRPTVDLCRHEDFVVDRLELLYPPEALALAEEVRADIVTVSPETEVRLHPLVVKDAWDFEQVYSALHDFARGYAFHPEQESYLVHVTTGTHVAQICLFLLTETRFFPACLVQTQPPVASERTRPGSYNIIDLDLSRYDRIAQRFRQEQHEGLAFLKSGIETKNPVFNALVERIEQVAIASRAPLLLTGPTGAGKSQLARKVYELKRARRQVKGELVEVNCATLRGDGAMSALFGHVKGAFTGALQERAGLLRAAHEGVLFLDEIGELGLDEQAMLLRALEDKTFLPMGSDRPVRSDFQLIAGTNRQLADAVRQGRFREDLLARINLWAFRLPGLRERPEDIEPNLDFELSAWTNAHGTRLTFNREARERFLAFARSPEALWSGNFRDFNAAITRMGTLAPGGRITEPVVQEELARLRAAWAHPEAGAGDGLLQEVLGEERLAALDAFDRVQLQEVVRVCRGARSLSDAGRQLFAVSREQKAQPNDADRLRKYLARFGLSWGSVQNATRLQQ